MMRPASLRFANAETVWHDPQGENTMLRTKFVATFAAALAFSSTTFASTYTEVDIGFNINFFGNNYSQIYLYDRGYVSLGGRNDDDGNEWTVSQATAYSQAPILIPDFSSKDPLYGGGLRSKENTTYEGHTAFVASWLFPGRPPLPPGAPPDHWGGSDDLEKGYALALVDRSDTGAGNFDFIFLYGSWPSSYHNYFGYTAEGNFYGYGYNGIDAPYSYTNYRIAFEVRDGLVVNPLPFVPPTIPEPQTYAMLLVGLGVVGFAAKRRRKSAV
jgi:hypothetical protein